MKTISFNYKCRQCGEVEADSIISLESVLDANLMLINAIEETPSTEVESPSLLAAHHCKSGGIGVSDIIGYTVIETP